MKAPDPEPPEQPTAKEKLRGFVRDVAGAAIRAGDETIEGERPWWKRRPRRGVPVEVKTDPSPAHRAARKNAKRHIDPRQHVCRCTGCGCHRLATDALCHPCSRGRHAASRTLRPWRQSHGKPTPPQNIARRIAARKSKAAIAREAKA